LSVLPSMRSCLCPFGVECGGGEYGWRYFGSFRFPDMSMLSNKIISLIK
jgi:hypothetical protein